MNSDNNEEMESLRAELRRLKRRPSRIAAVMVLSIGIAALPMSVFFSSNILAFIGLGLTFWGALLFYVAPTNYIKKDLLDSSILPSLSNIDKLIKELNYQGKPVYLSPRTLKGLKSAMLFIPREEIQTLPKPEEITEEKMFYSNPEGICIEPPGSSLAQLIEEELGVNLSTVNINYLENNLAKAIVEGLEIAEDIEIERDASSILVKIRKPVYLKLCREISKLEEVYPSIGCPLCSSIACILARVTNNLVQIEKINISKNDTLEVCYNIIEE